MLTIEKKRGTAARWTTVNPVLSDGEVGYETDTGRIKIGNGTVAWTLLPYYYATVRVTTTAGRPTAAAWGVGQMIYDSTLSKPVWSNGTVWKDSAGTTV